MDGPTSVNARCRQLPAVDRLLELAQEGTDLSRWSLVAAVRAVLDAARRAILAGEPNIYRAGYVQDALKEYCEAGITYALITGRPLPGPGLPTVPGFRPKDVR